MMKDKYFIIVNYTQPYSWPYYMWYDLLDFATIKYSPLGIKNPIFQKLHKFHFSNKINQRLKLPFKFIWSSYCSLKEEELTNIGINYIIFQTGVKYPPSYIKYLKGKYRCKIILYMPDTIENMGIAKNISVFKEYLNNYSIDQCFTFDPKDSHKFEIPLFDMYSKVSFNETIVPKNNLYYIGSYRTKERLYILHTIYNFVRDKMKVQFILNGIEKSLQLEKTQMIYNKKCNYKEVLNDLQNSSCILEILNENQSGNTLRFKEAICYDKKLLTNNKLVLKSKFYNSDYIQYIENIEDIDYDWILKDIKVDYNYSDEFSPKNFIKILNKCLG
jgi:hypothetical protein